MNHEGKLLLSVGLVKGTDSATKLEKGNRDCKVFSASTEAILLYTTVAARPCPSEVENTSGEEQPCSTSRTLSSYYTTFTCPGGDIEQVVY